MSVNKVILIGRLGGDPELKQTNSGMALCKFSLATSENWKDKSGEKQEKTVWHNVTVWGKLADICGKYLQKGKQVYVEGSYDSNTYEKDGQKRTSYFVTGRTVQFLSDGKKREENQNQGYDDQGFNPDEETIPF